MIAPVLKTGRGEIPSREFESHPLRFFIVAERFIVLERLIVVKRFIVLERRGRAGEREKEKREQALRERGDIYEQAPSENRKGSKFFPLYHPVEYNNYGIFICVVSFAQNRFCGFSPWFAKNIFFPFIILSSGSLRSNRQGRKTVINK